MSTNNNQQIKSSTRDKIATGFFIAAGFAIALDVATFIMCAINPAKLNLTGAKFVGVIFGLMVAAFILAVIGVGIKPAKSAPTPNIAYQPNSAQQQLK